jgi:pimeloyl-ACP methyl ester carboxylesterase
MKAAVLAFAAVGLAACGDPPPAPMAAATPPAPEYASTWFAAEGEKPGIAFNIHQTAFGLGGVLRDEKGDLQPIRAISLSDTEMAFAVPSLNAALSAEKAGDGSWAGKWTTGGKTTDLAIKPGAAPDTATSFVKFDDGRWTQFSCLGAGSPTILLDYGAGGSMNSWKDVFEPLSKVSRTCMFERAGRGLSDPGPMPRDVNRAVADIDAFIRAANIATPVILVGHSMASYHVRQFANLHLDKTAGIVLVDPSGDGQDARFAEAIPNMRELMPEIVDETTVATCSQGLRNLLPSLARSSTPDDLDPIVGKCGGKDPDRAEATLSEIASMEVISTGEIKTAARPYGDLPLIVLTRGDNRKGMPDAFTAENTAAFARVWNQMHAEMAAQSSAGKHRVVPGAGHSIQRDQPQVVIDAVAEVVAAARVGVR